jgi:ribosomal protein S18 acetylase RimI-like enzyme
VLDIRQMTAADVSLGMRLKEQAGWNQLEADWRRFLAMQPDGCIVAEVDGAPVGTAVGCIFGSVAWIAMVLVDVAVRGRGIGKALVEHTVSFVEGQGATCVRLDATPLGRPVYEKLGFLPQFSLTRYAGALAVEARPPASSNTPQTPARIARRDDFDAILALDRSVTRTDRRKFLLRLFSERPDMQLVERGGNVEGYLAVRHGSGALQLGPCIASADGGERLLRDACHRREGERVFLDVPLSHEGAVRFAESAGLVAQRTLTRMCRGDNVCDDVTRLWASSGPELG